MYVYGTWASDYSTYAGYWMIDGWTELNQILMVIEGRETYVGCDEGH